MRDLSAAFSAALAGDILYPIFFFEAEFANGTLNLCTDFSARVWDGKTWAGVGWLIGVSEVEETTETKATSLTIGLAANTELISTALLEVRRNKPMTIWMGLQSDGVAIGDPSGPWGIGDPASFGLGGEPGGLIDVQPLFAGLCDVYEIDVDPARPAIRISYSSKIADLERARVRRQTHEDQQIDYPGDRFFEYVGPLSDSVIDWG